MRGGYFSKGGNPYSASFAGTQPTLRNGGDKTIHGEGKIECATGESKERREDLIRGAKR